MIEKQKINGTGIRRLIRAHVCSWRGFQVAWHEAAFRQEIFLCIFLAPAGIWLGQSGVERALLVGSLFLVLIVELLNTAVEAVVDRISPEHHTLSGQAKDLGSAAVYFSLLNVVVIWTVILLSRL
ncbi:MAG: diacylglycerol kinase [Desulfobulbaceae bacterium]|nr:diacylglycerol kinase [Desulfobulbaceae bacterium]